MVISIHSAYFAPYADYMDGQVLMLTLIGTDENEDAVDVRMSVGADWMTDDGNVIVHPTKKKQVVNKNSIYGHFFAYALNIPELAKVLVERSAALDNRGASDARVWIDLILHLQTQTIEFGKNIASQERLMPTEYLGLTTDSVQTTLPLQQPVGGKPPQPPAPSAPSVPPTAPVTTGSDGSAMLAAARAAKAQEAAVTNGSPLYTKAIGYAKSAADFPAFLSMAFGDDEILADDELAEQCADESAVWASAHTT
jgi:hypothetical protein